MGFLLLLLPHPLTLFWDPTCIQIRWLSNGSCTRSTYFLGKKRDFWRRIEAHKFESNSFKKSLKQIQTSHLPWDLFDFAMNFRDFPLESQKNHDRPGLCGSGSRGFLYLHSPVFRRLVRSADGAGVVHGDDLHILVGGLEHVWFIPHITITINGLDSNHPQMLL